MFDQHASGESSRHKWHVLIIILMAPFMAYLDLYIVFVASPSIQHGLHASFEQIQFVIAGYTIAYGVNLITLRPQKLNKQTIVIVPQFPQPLQQPSARAILVNHFDTTVVANTSLWNQAGQLFVYLLFLIVLQAKVVITYQILAILISE